MEETAKPKRKPDYRLELLDNELLLYHPTETNIFYFNQTASLIWQLCDGQHSVAEIIELLKEAYPDAADTIPSDVTTTIQQFEEHGCIGVD
jgi:hypothetical protein